MCSNFADIEEREIQKWSLFFARRLLLDKHRRREGDASIDHGVTSAFSKFRIIMTGKNSDGETILALSGFEIYGTVIMVRMNIPYVLCLE